jgi:hypothetical protein
MKKMRTVALVLTCLSLATVLAVTSAWGADMEPRLATSVRADQSGVAITIYNSGLALVKDRRTVQLPVGRCDLRFMDVATAVIPASVQVRSLSDAAALVVLEQSYEYDLLSPQKLLEAYVGKEVKLYQQNPATGREEPVTATLLSTTNGPVYRIGTEIICGHPGRVIVPAAPDSLFTTPTLVWSLDNRRERPHTLEATYLTSGIAWRADYVMTLNEKDDRADLGGWITITNNSGATYRDAEVRLVAGEVNRVREEPRNDRALRSAMPMAALAAPQFKEEGLLEYQMYALQQPGTIKDNQSRQISLLTAANIPVHKELLLSGASYYYQNRYNGDITRQQKVGVYLELENRERHHLGIPLPRGTVRVYKQDSTHLLQFVGEDGIEHTPKDEMVRIRLGDAFDVVGDKRQTDWKKLADGTCEAAYEISIRNHKNEGVTVRVLEPVPGDWTLLESSHGQARTDGGILEYRLPVAAGGETKLTYRVRMRY